MSYLCVVRYVLIILSFSFFCDASQVSEFGHVVEQMMSESSCDHSCCMDQAKLDQTKDEMPSMDECCSDTSCACTCCVHILISSDIPSLKDYINELFDECYTYTVSTGHNYIANLLDPPIIL